MFKFFLLLFLIAFKKSDKIVFNIFLIRVYEKYMYILACENIPTAYKLRDLRIINLSKKSKADPEML